MGSGGSCSALNCSIDGFESVDCGIPRVVACRRGRIAAQPRSCDVTEPEQFSQASLDAAFSTLKLTLVLGAVALGLGVFGAAAGFALAAFTVLGISQWVVLREPRPEGDFEMRQLFRFGGWLLALTLVANLVLSADLWVVKRMAPPETANEQAGLYRAALTLARNPMERRFLQKRIDASASRSRPPVRHSEDRIKERGTRRPRR